MVLKTCSLFTSKIYQPKIKWKHGGLYFYKNQKYRRLQIDEKVFFLFFFISEILILLFLLQKNLRKKSVFLTWSIRFALCTRTLPLLMQTYLQVFF